MFSKAIEKANYLNTIGCLYYTFFEFKFKNLNDFV